MPERSAFVDSGEEEQKEQPPAEEEKKSAQTAQARYVLVDSSEKPVFEEDVLVAQ